jgi:hypothetical protein
MLLRPAIIPVITMPETLCKENLRPQGERGSGIVPGKSQSESLTVAVFIA